MTNLFELLDHFFEGIGFELRKRKWFKKVNDGFIVCEFQKFRYDIEGAGSGFLNFGIVYSTLFSSKITVPKGESTWHIRGRYKAIADLPNIDETFPIEILSPDQSVKVNDALVIIENDIIPFLHRYTTIKNLIQDLENETFDYARVLTSVDKDKFKD